MPDTVIVVPCYNEEGRLDRTELARLGSIPGTRAIYVDDGSKDQTARVLHEIAETAEDAQVLQQPRNQGKAEAVRQGMLRGIDAGASVVGFLDADLATPVDEIVRIVRELRARDQVHAALAARVALAGTRIERDLRRHYFGRVFSTGASIVLRQVIYDTQCGAKAFRVSPALHAALSESFLSRWAFDVELLGRLLAGAPGVDPLPFEAILEVPLERWEDVAGSKLSVPSMVKTTLELTLIERDLARRRARAR